MLGWEWCPFKGNWLNFIRHIQLCACRYKSQIPVQSVSLLIIADNIALPLYNWVIFSMWWEPAVSWASVFSKIDLTKTHSARMDEVCVTGCQCTLVANCLQKPLPPLLQKSAQGFSALFRKHLSHIFSFKEAGRVINTPSLSRVK